MKSLKGLEALEKIDKITLHDKRRHCDIEINVKNIFSKELSIIEKSLKAIEIIKKYFELTEDDDEYEIFHYGLHDKQYVSSRSSLCIQSEEFELLKEVFNEDA